MPVINCTEDQMLRFKKIAEKRPQDNKQSETFDYLLRFYEERRDGTISFHNVPVISVEKSQIVAALKEKDKERERALAPTRDNIYRSEK